jgi:hypothetical protein
MKIGDLVKVTYSIPAYLTNNCHIEPATLGVLVATHFSDDLRQSTLVKCDILTRNGMITVPSWALDPAGEKDEAR